MHNSTIYGGGPSGTASQSNIVRNASSTLTDLVVARPDANGGGCPSHRAGGHMRAISDFSASPREWPQYKSPTAGSHSGPVSSRKATAPPTRSIYEHHGREIAEPSAKDWIGRDDVDLEVGRGLAAPTPSHEVTPAAHEDFRSLYHHRPIHHELGRLQQETLSFKKLNHHAHDDRDKLEDRHI